MGRLSLPDGTWNVPPWPFQRPFNLLAGTPLGLRINHLTPLLVQSKVENSSTALRDPAQRLLIRATDPASRIIFQCAIATSLRSISRLPSDNSAKIRFLCILLAQGHVVTQIG